MNSTKERAIRPPTPAISELNDDQMVNEFWAADVLGLTVKTLRRWRWARRGPAWHVIGGRAVRYRVATLRDYLAAGEVDPASFRTANA